MNLLGLFVFLVLSVVVQGCSPVPDWRPKSVTTLTQEAIYVGVGVVTNTTFDEMEQNAWIQFECVYKRPSGTSLDITAPVNVRGFRGSAACSVSAQTDDYLIVFFNVDQNQVASLYERDLHAGVKQATPVSLSEMYTGLTLAERQSVLGGKCQVYNVTSTASTTATVLTTTTLVTPLLASSANARVFGMLAAAIMTLAWSFISV